MTTQVRDDLSVIKRIRSKTSRTVGGLIRIASRQAGRQSGIY